MSATSIAPCARSSAETAAESSASPPVWVVIARLVRSCRPTLTITTGLPSAAARSSAAAKRSGSRIASMNPPTMAVCGSSRRYSRNAAALTVASLPEETIWLKPKRRVSVSRPTQRVAGAVEDARVIRVDRKDPAGKPDTFERGDDPTAGCRLVRGANYRDRFRSEQRGRQRRQLDTDFGRDIE